MTIQAIEANGTPPASRSNFNKNREVIEFHVNNFRHRKFRKMQALFVMTRMVKNCAVKDCFPATFSRILFATCFLVSAFGGEHPVCAQSPEGVYIKKDTWAQTLLASREAQSRPGADFPKDQTEVLRGLECDFPMQWDWMLQDEGGGTGVAKWFEKTNTVEFTAGLIRRAIQELGADGRGIQADLDALIARALPAGDPQWLELYEKACQQRREARLKPIVKNSHPIVFTKHYNLGGSHYAYTEGQSDAQGERHFLPGSELCLMEFNGGKQSVRTLLKDAGGVIRDPAVSYDGKRVLFAWKKSDREDDYHLYEMEIGSGKVRQLTTGLGFADYEGTYLPNGDILFNSTRCVQTVDCWWTEVSNLYTCDKDGKFLRRITFDQVHDNYPTVMNDGRVIYTRWEYNDRGQLFPQPLFQMNPDGTGQTEFYGNNSWFPTSILHARAIPGSRKVMGILSGHHCRQAGKLAVIDPSKGRQEAEGVQLIAPVRETKADRIDAYGQDGELFQYPYPLSEDACLVAYHPVGWPAGKDDRLLDQSRSFMEPNFKIYFMAGDGRRELLVADPAISCNQPVELASRPVPFEHSSTVDYSKSVGTFSMQNIYAGKALPGVEKGTVKRLRVVALDFRAAGVKHNGNRGPAGGALVCTPPSIHNGSWDPKIVLGDATVYDDGSAFFQAPASMPLYFMALNEKGHVVQTMRSWSTLQPGENASCVGCHEDKNTPALASPRATKAMVAGAEPLKPFYGPARPFSFSTEIQPILDRHCVSCHNVRSIAQTLPVPKASQAPAATPAPVPLPHPKPDAFSLTSAPNVDKDSGRIWSDAYLYLTNQGNMTPVVNWIGTQSIPPMLPPYFAGAAKSSLIEMLEKGHQKVQLSQEEMDKIACWIDLLVPYCGDYTEATDWSPNESQKYERYFLKRRRMQEIERAGINEMLAAQSGPQASVTIRMIDAAGNSQEIGRPFQQGDRIQIQGPSHMMVRLSQDLPEALIYSPEGRVEFPVPVAPEDAAAYPAKAFAGSKPSARPATAEEIAADRNLALNPYDVRGITTFFPHATSNSECRNNPRFAARNAIDGSVKNQGHGGWPNQSWGPDQRTDLWWRVDLGRLVTVDKLVIYARCDFPHDKVWSSATVRFSDGSTQRIELRAANAPQTFTFEKRKASWVELADLVQEKPPGWCALSEVEVYGNEAGAKAK